MAILGIHVKFLWGGTGYTKKKVCKKSAFIQDLFQLSSIQFDPLRRVGHGRQHGGAAGLHAFQAAGRFQNFIELMSLEAGEAKLLHGWIRPVGRWLEVLV